MKDLNQNIQKPFKFLKFWIAHEKFKDIMKKNWDIEFSGNNFYKFNQKLKLIKKVITKWSKDNFGPATHYQGGGGKTQRTII